MNTEKINPDIIREDQPVTLTRQQLAQWEKALESARTLIELMQGDEMFTAHSANTLSDIIAAVAWEINLAWDTEVN